MKSFRTIKIDGITDSMLQKSKLLDLRRSTSTDTLSPVPPTHNPYYMGMRLTDSRSIPNIHLQQVLTEYTQPEDTSTNERVPISNSQLLKYSHSPALKPLKKKRTPSLEFNPFSNMRNPLNRKQPITFLERKTPTVLTNDLLDTSSGYKLIQKKTDYVVQIPKPKESKESVEILRTHIPKIRKLAPINHISSTPKVSSQKEEFNDHIKDAALLKRIPIEKSEAVFISKQMHFKRIISDKDNVISLKIRQLDDKFRDARVKLQQLRNRIIEGPLTRMDLS